MGKIPVLSPPELHVRVSRLLLERVTAEAGRLDQSVSAYVRMALTEKLERDGRGR